MRVEVFVCDKCKKHIQGGYQLAGPLRRIEGNRLTVILDRAGDFCSSCIVGGMVEAGIPEAPAPDVVEISLDESLEEHLTKTDKFGADANRPPAIPPATVISNKKRERIL